MRTRGDITLWLVVVGLGGLGSGACDRAPVVAPEEASSGETAPEVDAAEETEGFLMAADGAGLYYRKIGAGPVVILPGRLFAYDDFRWLAEAGRTLIAYDMRNRGRSEAIADPERLTLAADIEDLEAVRRHFGVETFTPIGYSYLGLMVVLYAIEQPDRVERIVQLGPVPIRFGTEYPPEQRAELAPDPEVVARLRQQRSEQRHVDHPREYCAEEWTGYARPLLVGDLANVDRIPSADFMCSMPNEWPIRLARHFEHHFGSVQRLEPPLERIAALPRPVLVVHGRLDRNAPYGAGREWASTLPDARLLTVERGAHQSFAEYPDLVRPAIRAFLEGDWPPEAQQVSD
jgi:proline iminopeptidase